MDENPIALDSQGSAIHKIARVTLFFWVMKVIATTLGETAGDFFSMSLNLGYAAALAITVALLALTLTLQIGSGRFRPPLFWLAIIATTTTGTEISDLMDRTLGLGYVDGSLLLLAGLITTLGIWYYRDKSLSIDCISRTDAEIMFWVAVIFSNSLGTAFGDALVDVAGLSYLQGAAITAGIIALVLASHYATRISAIVLFWIAFVFTRPFGATFGDFLTKPRANGALALDRLHASLIELILLLLVMAVAYIVPPEETPPEA